MPSEEATLNRQSVPRFTSPQIPQALIENREAAPPFREAVAEDMESPQEALTIQVTEEVANLRSGPGLVHPTLGETRQGELLPVTGISADDQWLQVEPAGARLWIYADRTDVSARVRLGLPERQAVYLGDRTALGALFALTEGSDWVAGLRAYWLSDTPLDNWSGVTTNDKGQVTRLELAEAGLRGPLPAALGQLSALVSLDLRNNRLYGPMPKALGQLLHLQELYLGGNAWTGCLPTAWRDLSTHQSDIGVLTLPYCDTEVTGSYEDPTGQFVGTYHLQRRETQVTAILRTMRAPRLPTDQTGPVLFTLPLGYYPPVPYTRHIWGHRVSAAGLPLVGGLERPQARLRIGPDGTVRLEAEEGDSGFGYWAFTVTGAWDITSPESAQLVVPTGRDVEPRVMKPETLHEAASLGRVDVVKQLLAEGGKVQAQDETRRTALHYAAQEGQVEVVVLLLAVGADMSASDQHGATPLHLASSAGHVKVAKLLLAAGADLTASDEINRTPMARAIMMGREEMVTLLLAAGANMWLDLAIQFGTPAIVRQFLEAGADPNSSPSTKWTPLNRAVTFHNEEVVDLLLAAGADPEHALMFFRRFLQSPSSPLATASPTIAEKLLLAGANPNITDDLEGLLGISSGFSRSPLYEAAIRGEAILVDLLLSAGANPNVMTAYKEDPVYHGWTPLDVLCSSGGNITGPTVGKQGTVVLQRLLAAGADPNSVTGLGQTPLHAAVQRDWVAGVDLLLAAGANPHQPDAVGVTPLQMAEQAGQMALAELLRSRLASGEKMMDYGWTPLHMAVQHENRKKVVELLTQGFNPNLRTYYGETPLHVAARRQDVAIIKLLLQAGADLHAETLDLYTPLHTAAQTGKREVVASLLAAGADEQHMTARGETPHAIAMRYNRPVVAALLRSVGGEIPAASE